jgi:hypothetical protein
MALEKNIFGLDRMVMPDEELFDKINASNVDIFLFYVNKEVAGYIEFVKEEKYVEILYFGLMPALLARVMVNIFYNG